ncbi:MAG: DUF434 domain-containing protein [Anaerotruncus sp.]|jgi:hypothetical protein|nr:DUF434 domain-containing protein [Anaerotruncus sp.]
MPQEVKRGFVPGDAREFGGKQLAQLQNAQQDIVYLLDRGYEVEKAVTFVGNRFQFSARQRTALTRASASSACAAQRRAKEAVGSLKGQTAFIDGFNLIITLEAALSDTTLLFCVDGTVRDLCGLHGTYRLIDKTELALRLIAERLAELEIGKAMFYLDAPVSNSGRLSAQIQQSVSGYGYPVAVEMAPNADACLWDKPLVITTDAIILNRCGGWVNLARQILHRKLPKRKPVNLSNGRSWPE